MKKLFAILTALTLVLGMTAAFAEATPFTIRNNITFGMNMDKVIAAETERYHEIDNEHTHGGITFSELEYEHVRENNFRVDIKYLFVGNELVAARFNYEARDISYAQLKADLAAKYHEFDVPGRLEDILGRGIYAVDDDGRPEGRIEATIFNNVAIVLEQDEDDIEVTFVDLAAGYIKQ